MKSILLAVLIAALPFDVRADDAKPDPRVACPPGEQICKVIVLTRQEEAALVQPNMILDTAQRARYLDLAEAVKYFREKIEKAPSGDVTKPPEVKKD